MVFTVQTSKLFEIKKSFKDHNLSSVIDAELFSAPSAPVEFKFELGIVLLIKNNVF